MKYLLLAVLVLLSACEKRVVVTDPASEYKRGRFQADNFVYDDKVHVIEDVQTGQKYLLCSNCQLTPLKAKEAP